MIARVLLSKILSPLKFQVPPDASHGNRRAAAPCITNAANFFVNVETRAVGRARNSVYWRVSAALRQSPSKFRASRAAG
jgi:hypothetical protein